MKCFLRYVTLLVLVSLQLSVYAQPKKLADAQLSNLDSVTAVNSHLLPESTISKDLGSSSLLWNNLYLKRLQYLTGTQGAGKVMASNANGEGNWYSFITGSSGSDFSIQFTGNDFIFNLPDATSSSRGLLTAADWNAFNSKQGTLNGTGLVRMNGTSISYDNTPYVPANRTLTINGTPYDLSEDRNINIGGLSLGSIGNSPNGNGATISGNILNLEPASENYGGVISTGAQTFSGLKTFSNDITVNTMTIGKGNGQINSNSAIGFETLGANTTGQNNTALGFRSLKSNTTGSNNIAIGTASLFNNLNGSVNTAIGQSTLQNNTSGFINTAVGANALQNNINGWGNAALGHQALQSNSSGEYNTASGFNALKSNTDGDENSALGSNADVASGSLINATAIGARAFVASSNSIVLGSITGVNAATSNTNVGIGTTTPTNRLHVAGTVRIEDGSQGAGKVLTSDANGVASWQPASGATLSLAAIGSSPNSNGATVSGNTINLEPASAAYGGVITTGQQQFTGQKQFIDDARINGMTVGKGNGSVNTNTVFGLSALASNSSGDENVAIGFNALNSNSTGGSNNAIGFRTLETNTTGSSNIAIGKESLRFNTTGSTNTAVGSNSLRSNISGGSNSAFGYGTLTLNTTGLNNDAFGTNALWQNTSGGYNAAFGGNTMAFNTSGGRNAAFGFQSLISNTTGNYNTTIGQESLIFNTTGWFNTAVGGSAGVSAGNLDNTTTVGYGVMVSASNSVRIGNSAVTSIGGEVGWSTLSDGRYKTNLKNNVPGLEFINQLKPVTYNLDVQKIQRKLTGTKQARTNGVDFTDPMENAIMKKAMDEKSKVVYTGFVAQDVAQIADKMGYDFSGVDKPQNENESFYAIRYAEFVVPLVKAVQELSAENEVLKNRLERMEALLAKGANHESDKSPASTVFLSSARLDQNIPNPAGNQTIIKYYIPQNTQQAEIRITGIRGELIKSIRLNSKGEGQVNLSMEYLVNGNYIYSLLVDGQIIDSRKMVITK